MSSPEESPQPFTPDEQQRLRRLLDEDDIRSLATRYAHYMDHGYIDRFREVFTDDICCEFGPYGSWRGIDEVLKSYHAVYQELGNLPFASLHAVTGHWIQLLSNDAAMGRRQLLDFVTQRPPEESPLLWLAVYEDEYRRCEEGWRICRMAVSFLWPERLAAEDFPTPFPPT